MSSQSIFKKLIKDIIESNKGRIHIFPNTWTWDLEASRKFYKKVYDAPEFERTLKPRSYPTSLDDAGNLVGLIHRRGVSCPDLDKAATFPVMDGKVKVLLTVCDKCQHQRKEGTKRYCGLRAKPENDIHNELSSVIKDSIQKSINI